MTFDMQDAIELSESANGMDAKITFRDGTHTYCQLGSYDHRFDEFDTSAGKIRRTRIENVVVIPRMDAVIEQFESQGICGDGSKTARDSHIMHGRKTTKPNLAQMEDDPSGYR